MTDGSEATESLGAEATGGSHLLVIDGAMSTIVGLPRAGSVDIGRAPECAIRLGDPACSRRHAQLHLSDGEITLEDLGSHNGTRVNGERVAGRRALSSDDVISIGPIKLVLHTAGTSRRAAVLHAGMLRERLAQEAERAVSYERPFSVAVVAVDPSARDAAAQALADHVRFVDVVGYLDEHHVAVLLPELLPEAARIRVEELLAPLDAVGEVAIGLAHCPGDAARPEALVAAARSAARDTGKVCEAEECVIEYQLGDGVALVADAAMLQVYDLLRRLAPSDLAVLISGETGVGKENAARALHVWSRRASRPFVALNCASLPDTLVESELFGYEKGAFSGATAAKPGRLEAASGGTVFLDEVGELPLATQAKFLRVLESKQLVRLGALKELAIDVRIVAATNRDLEAEVKAGRFREDLFFRLGGAKVVLPPLRDRPRELALLARYFLQRACAAVGRDAPELSTATLGVLGRHGWAGNIRELKHEMDYVAATAGDRVIEPWHLSERIARATPAPVDDAAPAPRRDDRRTFRPIHDELRDLERRRMMEALAASGGVQKHAAALIEMPHRTFSMKYKQYGLGEK